MPEHPLVSALMAAYNAEPFIAEALDSALAQDWPADRLEIVVVDDGSTDGTAAVVEGYVRRHPGRVRLIRQANGGPCAATNTALAAARGEWLALLDADDAWPREKLRVQGAVLAARPEVGLVYGDMRVVDAEGNVIQESWMVGEEALPEGRCLAELLAGNTATASSVLMRAALAEPIPAEIPYTDWWFAARAALVSELAYVEHPRTLYRFHGRNITLGVEGADRVRELRKALAFVRWFLRRLEPGVATPRGLARAWSYFDRNARELLDLLAWPLAPLVEVSAADRAECGAGLAGASALLRRGRASDAVTAFTRAAAADPTSEPARDGLMTALAATLPERPGQQPLLGAQGRVVLAFADELLADPGLLDAWARRMRGVPGVTLAVEAAGMDAVEATEALGAIAGDLPGDVDVLAVLGPLDEVGRARLAAGVHAVYSERAGDEPAVPRVGVAALGRLATQGFDA
jgi:glycosyltransferase involved in cell wall biosynthesis